MVKSDLEIVQENTMMRISDVAEKIGIDTECLEYYGKYKAKVDSSFISSLKNKKNGKLILVTAINPTKAGEGKTTTTVGLIDGLAKINKKVMGALREPSLGPVFGIKGGATGGGYAQVVPMEDINLHFTGDMHAITTANNLISAAIDNHMFHGNELQINPEKILWKRCLDMNDRALRNVTVAQGPKQGIERKDGFNITVASEIMAILCLSNDIHEFQTRVERCVVAFDMNDKPVTVKNLKVGGAVAAIMKDALKPNLVQTLEHTPVLIHGGPFANIAHGCNSVIATKTALKLADYVVTEAGFGADLGAEKFVDIKCRMAGLQPSAIVLVVTIRALKLHGGMDKNQLTQENVDAVRAGFANVEKHIETLKAVGVPFVLAMNHFYLDTEAEVACVNDICREKGYPIVLAKGWADGGNGMVDLANKVVELCEEENHFQFIYDVDAPFEEKVLSIVQKVYGGKDVVYTEDALKQLAEFKKFGWDKLPICMAKTPNSLTDDAKVVGRPKDFTITVKELRISAGAGFVVVLTGSIMTMPGLPKVPAANSIGIDENDKIFGLF
ncbi:MAG: formate--tetrahydrofolate ligase [Erysipelotrichaceae bacterium]|nr:formate--tetrahydrofolate ligase [Erysipelotrichaceae bacterium]